MGLARNKTRVVCKSFLYSLLPIIKKYVHLAWFSRIAIFRCLVKDMIMTKSYKLLSHVDTYAVSVIWQVFNMLRYRRNRDYCEWCFRWTLGVRIYYCVGTNAQMCFIYFSRLPYPNGLYGDYHRWVSRDYWTAFNPASKHSNNKKYRADSKHCFFSMDLSFI